MSQVPDTYPADRSIGDEQFAELTGGIQKQDIRQMIFDINDYAGKEQIGLFYVPVDDDNTIIVHVPHGVVKPTLEFITRDTLITIRSFRDRIGQSDEFDDRCTITVEPQTEELKPLGTIHGTLQTAPGEHAQAEEDFALIPASHWKAMDIAWKEIQKQKAAKAQKRGGFLRRLSRK